MIRIITRDTHRFYEGMVEKAHTVPGLRDELKTAHEDTATWKAQSEDYRQQRDQERERTDQLTSELRAVQQQLDGQRAEFNRQMDEASRPLAEMLEVLVERTRHPATGDRVRAELALVFAEQAAEHLSAEDRKSPLGVILSVISAPRTPDRDQAAEAETPPAESLPQADPAVVGQMMDAATLRGPDPFPGTG
ncbi:hypothetical protein [Streptomyces jumonjinensis]|uniref:hypothetical protein n=1 Tax=Streptomyces jumonjinensis TaxID=1945 RepID=UPI0037BB530F